MILYNKKYGKKSHCKITLLLPEFTFVKHRHNIYGNGVSTKKISFNTSFDLTSNKNYINIGICVLGFGLRIQILD